MRYGLITVAYVFHTKIGMVTVRIKDSQNTDYNWCFEVENLLRPFAKYAGYTNGACNAKLARNLLRQALTEWKVIP